MDMLLKGKRALITGSTSGIGAQCARVLAGEGVSVVINGRNADRAAAVTEEIRKVGGEAKFVLGDVTTEDGSNAVIEGAKSSAIPSFFEIKESDGCESFSKRIECECF